MNRDFKGIWIPREIWLNPHLTLSEKNLWAEIHSLYDREKGGCYASNEYLMGFIGVKERALQQMMSNLKKHGLLEQVHFNGRQRIIRAKLAPEDLGSCGAEVHLNAGQRCRKMHPRGAEKCTPPHIYLDTSIDKRLDLNPPIPPFLEEGAKAPMSAKADEMDLGKAPPSFSEESKKTADEFVTLMIEAKPDYAMTPQKKAAILTHVDFMLRLDKRSPQKIRDLLLWILSDPFWKPHIFKPNPAKYLREKFDQLEEKMNYKPMKTHKPRVFAPSSDDNKALQKMREGKRDAI